MEKKQGLLDPHPLGLDQMGLLKPHKRLDIRRIRELQAVLMKHNPGDPLPDWRDLSLAQRFAVALRLIPPDQREALLGKSETQIRRYEAGAEIPFTVVGALALEAELPIQWIATGAPTEESGEPLDEGFELVHRLETRASAGGGAIMISPDEPNDFVAFRSDWLRRLGLNPKSARTLFAQGDSMEPTIADGDLLLVDESIDRVVDHGIYVVVYQGMVLVKRAQVRRDGTLVLSSDNPRYKDEIVPPNELPELTIAGRVRWYGRTI